MLSSSKATAPQLLVLKEQDLGVYMVLSRLVGFFLQLQGQTHTSACVLFLTVTKAGCLKGNSLPLWQALNQLFAGLRGGRGTFTHPFSQGRYSPSLPIKSHFLHSMHELQPHQYIRYCG